MTTAPAGLSAIFSSSKGKAPENTPKIGLARSMAGMQAAWGMDMASVQQKIMMAGKYLHPGG